MSGLSVLDIGCNAGFYALRLAARGARVLGVDVDEHYLRQARWARERFGFSADQIDLRRMQVYELAQLEEAFDIVLFMGVLYHLRYPLLALDIVAGKVRGRLVLQTLTMPGDDVLEAPEDLPIHARAAMTDPGWPVMAFIEHALAGDPTNWWAPNQACVEAMLRSAGLEPRERPGHEIVVAHRTSPPRMPDELQAILRKHWVVAVADAVGGQCPSPRPVVLVVCVALGSARAASHRWFPTLTSYRGGTPAARRERSRDGWRQARRWTNSGCHVGEALLGRH